MQAIGTSRKPNRNFNDRLISSILLLGESSPNEKSIKNRLAPGLKGGSYVQSYHESHGIHTGIHTRNHSMIS